MKSTAKLVIIGALFLVLTSYTNVHQNKKSGWTKLFDGKTFDGWKANENPATFSIQDGMIVVFGSRAHLFYTGPFMDHNFKNGPV
jgi:hypothetical protein